MTTKKLLQKILAVLIITTLGTTANADLISNGGFEAGTGTDADGWAEIATATNGSAERSSADPNTGTYSAALSFDNSGSAVGANYLVQYNSAVGSIDPSEDFDLRFFARAGSTDFTGIQFFVNLQWLDQDGSDGGGVQGQTLLSLIGDAGILNASTISTTYQEFSLLDIDAPDGADSFQLSFELPAGAVADISNSLFIDDVSFAASTAAVPEPNTISLIGIVMAGCFARRRRK